MRVEVEPGGDADGRGGQRVVDRQPAERRDARPRARRPASRAGSASRRSRRDSTARRRARRPSRRSRSAATRAAVRRSIRRDDRVVGVEDRRAVRRQRLDAARPWPARPPRASRSATGGPPGPRSRRRSTGGAMAARSAISPPTYMPISSTAASCSGPRRRTVSGRPISLFWLPSLLSVRSRRGQDRGDGLLGRGLGDAPGDADDERVEARRQPAATAPSAAMPSATRMTVTSPSVVGIGRRAGHEHGRGAPARPRRRGGRGRPSARRAGRRTACPA